MATPYAIVERLLDKYDVADVLIMIGDVCAYKAELETNWQDADAWLKAERTVKRTVRSLPKVPGIK